jgi:hypothetical protein
MTANVEIKVLSVDDPTRRAIVNEIYFALSKLQAPDPGLPHP